VFKLAHPAPRTKEAVISWFSGGEESGREKQFLSYTVMSTIFDDDKKVNDLVSLHSPPGDDRVSRALYWASPYLGGLLKVSVHSRDDFYLTDVSLRRIRVGQMRKYQLYQRRRLLFGLPSLDYLLPLLS
jgi:hypothetical protein